MASPGTYRAVESVERVANISAEAFERDYYEPERPVILTGKMSSWRAMREWTPQTLKQIFGDSVLHASLDLPTDEAPGNYKWTDHTKWMKVSEFVDILLKSERPCYMRQAPSNRLPGFDDYFDFGAFFVDVAKRDPQPNLWFGSARTDSGLHWDTAMNFLAQVYGRKEFILFPQSEARNLYAFRDQIRWSGFNALAPDFERYPKAKKARGIRGVLEPGEAIFIPRTWWHQFRSMETAISVNCFFRPECSTWDLCAAIANGGWQTVYNVTRDFVRFGILKRGHENRMFADIPTGMYLYNLTTAYFRRRLH